MDQVLSQTAEVATKKSAGQSCRRCSGYMASDMCIDLESDSGRSIFWVLRCIHCGDMVDEVILRNRSLFNPEAVLIAVA
jgi:hypothetical protein